MKNFKLDPTVKVYVSYALIILTIIVFIAPVIFWFSSYKFSFIMMIKYLFYLGFVINPLMQFFYIKVLDTTPVSYFDMMIRWGKIPLLALFTIFGYYHICNNIHEYIKENLTVNPTKK